MSKNLSYPLAGINMVIVRCTREGKKCTASRSGRPVPLDQTLHFVKINFFDNPCCKASVMAWTVDVSPITAVCVVLLILLLLLKLG